MTELSTLPRSFSDHRTESSRNRPRLSVCMIVRDNAGTIVPCLESIRPWVDEIVVVDTGSVDNTPEVCRQLGANVSSYAWIDDFSAARNESFSRARGEWLFWMDSDDTIDAMNGKKLRELVDGVHEPQVLGYVLQVHCPGSRTQSIADTTVVDHVKLVRSHPQVRFEGRIHEQLLMPIRQLGGEVRFTDIFVVHSGADYTLAGRRRKHERDLRILHKDLAERPDHPFVLFNMGMTYSDMEQHVEAAGWLERSLQLADPGESHVRKAYALLANCYARLMRLNDALQVCIRGRELYPKDSELLFREGMLLHDLGRWSESVIAYQGALANDDERHFSSVDQGISGSKARHNLAVVYRDMGRSDLAEIEWRRVLEDGVAFSAAHRELVETLIRERKLATAEIEIEGMMADEMLRPWGWLLLAKLHVARQDLPSAKSSLEAACRENPENEEVLEAFCRFLFEHGEPSEAMKSLSEFVQRYPHDGSAYHNLGQVFQRMSDHPSAVKAFRHSIAVRANSAVTYVQLGHSLWTIGDRSEAIGAWEQARRLSPEDMVIKDLLVEARRQAKLD